MTIRLWGSEKLANTTTTNGQSGSVVAGLNNGSFVTAWVDDMGAGSSVVKFQRFDAFGNKIGVETVLPVADGEGDQIKPSIAAMADGGFVIALQDMDPANSPTDSDVRALRFNSSGLLINQAEMLPGYQDSDPTVIASGTGYEVAFSVSLPDADPILIRVNSANVTTTIDIAPVLANNPFATISASDGSNSYLHYINSNSVIMKRVDEFGSIYPPSSYAVPLLTIDYSIVGLTAVRVSDNIFASGALVQYNSLGNFSYHTDIVIHDSVGGFIARHVLPSGGSPVQFQVLGDGTFVAVYDQPGVGGGDVFLQQFSATGTPIGGALPIAEGTVGEIDPDVTRLADGRLIVTWTDTSGSDGSDSGIYQRILDPREGFVIGTNDPLVAETLIGNDSFNDQILGRAGADILYGLAGADTIYGGAGADQLVGGRGDDTLYGGADGDTLIGGLGADEIYGDAGTDTISYVQSRVGVQVNLLTGEGFGGDAEGDTIAGVENVIGSNFGDVIVGSNSVTARIEGLTGDDNLTGGTGADTFVGGAGADTINGLGGIDRANYSASTAISINLLTNTNTGGEAQGDVLTNIEEVSGSAFADIITGNALKNHLLGQSGADRLDGGVGADTLTGGGGSDSFVFNLNQSGTTATTHDFIADYTKGVVGVGDEIDFASALSIGGTPFAATATVASINANSGVATFAAGSGTTLADALADIANSINVGGTIAGEFAFFLVNNTSAMHMFISDGVAGIGAGDVLVRMTGVTTVGSISIDAGDVTILT